MSLPLADLGASGWRLVYVVSLVWLLVAGRPAAPPAGDAALRGTPAPRDRDRRRRTGARRPPAVRRSSPSVGVRRQPVRRAGVVLPEPLPRRRARVQRRRHRAVHARHRDAGVARADRSAAASPTRAAGGAILAVALPLATALLVASFSSSGSAMWVAAFFGGLLGGLRLPGVRGVPHRAVPHRHAAARPAASSPRRRWSAAASG